MDELEFENRFRFGEVARLALLGLALLARQRTRDERRSTAFHRSLCSLRRPIVGPCGFVQRIRFISRPQLRVSRFRMTNRCHDRKLERFKRRFVERRIAVCAHHKVRCDKTTNPTELPKSITPDPAQTIPSTLLDTPSVSHASRGNPIEPICCEPFPIWIAAFHFPGLLEQRP